MTPATVQRVGERTMTDSLSKATAVGVPNSALEVYARWWQLETYLREVVYTELRCAYGRAWVEHLGDGAPIRAERDRVNAYMASADADELLGYADVTALLRVIDAHWHLFEAILLPRTRWLGLCDELIAIRNRNAHCRRPHPDDRARLEQALRNLEPGAREFYRSYCRARPIPKNSKDPLARSWIGERHQAASRLIEHCRRKYGTQFRLEYSLRPWGGREPDTNHLSMTPGLLWQAHWTLADEPDPVEVWRGLTSEERELLVHLIFDGVLVQGTFAAADDDRAIADSIGHIFDRLITTVSRWRPKSEPSVEEIWATRRAAAEKLPPKVKVDGIFTYFDPLNPDMATVFAAEA
jgi:Swt1-like HEPN